jgi:hypothetical protein
MMWALKLTEIAGNPIREPLDGSRITLVTLLISEYPFASRNRNRQDTTERGTTRQF